MALISLRQLLDHAAGQAAKIKVITLPAMAARYANSCLDPSVSSATAAGA